MAIPVMDLGYFNDQEKSVSLRKLIGYLAALAVLCVASLSCAEEFKLPDAMEISTFPPEALQFYNDGLKALDHVDYVNSYEQFAKASQLAPGAIRLGFVTAALALKQGRSKQAADAKPYYETAISAYQNILHHPDLDEAIRRDATNRLKIATDERDNLAQRDVRREVMGNRFVQDLNRQYVPSTPRAGQKVGTTPTPGIGTPAAVYGGQQQYAPPPGGAPPISPFVQGQPQPTPAFNPVNPQPAI